MNEDNQPSPMQNDKFMTIATHLHQLRMMTPLLINPKNMTLSELQMCKDVMTLTIKLTF